MLTDKQNTFSAAQAVTTTALSTHVFDTGPLYSGNTGRNLGAAEDLWLFINVGTAVTADGSATVTFTLETDDAEAIDSASVLWTSGAVAKATLIAGYTVAKFQLPAATYLRYLAVRYTVGTGPLTAGTFNAYLVPGADVVQFFAPAVTNAAA